jgi:4-amino-4-deoxy-L-arabinose transferase-like glycosyltransferase
MPEKTDKPHFSILATSFAGGPRPRNAATILAGLWLLLFFASLFAPPILDDADATHAQAARAMLATGDFVTLHVDGIRYLEKAPLPYWLTALSFRLFGFNTFAAHLPQALAVALLVLLGHRWANQAFGARTAFYTSIALLTSVGIFLFTRILIPDILLSLLLGASLFAFLKSLTPVVADQNSPPGWPILPGTIGKGGSDTVAPPQNRVPHVSPLRHGLEPAQTLPYTPTDTPTEAPTEAPTESPAIAWYAGPYFYPYVMWATLALAVLAKGLVALVFFFATTLLFLLLTNPFPEILKDTKRLKPLTGLLLFLAIAAPWHILAALRNPATSAHHGFLWFYFWNEHVLRFLGRRTPRDYNKLPGYAFWLQHLAWLFPWSLFLPLGITAIRRRLLHQRDVLTRHIKPDYSWKGAFLVVAFYGSLGVIINVLTPDIVTPCLIDILLVLLFNLITRRVRAHLTVSPFHRIDAQQRSILLLSLFAAVVLLFFSLSTNQEYYTLPAYLPILLLIAATITRAEQTYTTSPESRRWITVAHASFSAIGALAALALVFGLWQSRHLPYNPDIGTLLAHRAVGDYTLSTSHLFDLTTSAFASLRLPAILAALALTLGPALAWMLRTQRRHIAATTAIAFTSAAFLFAAHLAFARFAPMLSSQRFAAGIQHLESTREIPPNSQILLFGDQSYGSSIPFYIGRQVFLVDGRSSSLLFGASFADAANIFLTPTQLQQSWGKENRKILFVPAEHRAEVEHLLGPNQVLLDQSSGKLLLTDRPLPP